MILLLTLPGLDPLRKGLISVTKALLKPFFSVIPFCLFLLLDIYWKYEMRPSCVSLNGCTHAEHLRHHKSLMKSQRNGILIASALLFYWLLYSVTKLVVRVEELKNQVEKQKDQNLGVIGKVGFRFGLLGWCGSCGKWKPRIGCEFFSCFCENKNMKSLRLWNRIVTL